MKVSVMCRKFECREDIHYKTQTWTSREKMYITCEIDAEELFQVVMVGSGRTQVLLQWERQAVSDYIQDVTDDVGEMAESFRSAFNI